MKNKRIDSTILLSFKANPINEVSFMQTVTVERWKIVQNSVTHQRNDSHTLSLYLAGGETSYRADQPWNKGGAGKFTLLPEGHISKWHINGAIDFVHLNFTDEKLKQFASSTYDTDVRLIDLRDLTYQDDQKLQQLFLAYLKACESQYSPSPLYAEETLNQIFNHLITNYNGFPAKHKQLRGGLSPNHRRKVKSVIYDLLDQKLSIESLASLVGLSAFHFARMFRESFGETPAQFITRARIEKVKQLLKNSRSISEICYLAGFCHQSHMTAQFKKLTGTTPALYKAHYMLGNRAPW